MEHSESQFHRLFSASDEVSGERAPSSLKAKIYTALVRQQQQSGPLLGLNATEEAGHKLCSWKNLSKLCRSANPRSQCFIVMCATPEYCRNTLKTRRSI